MNREELILVVDLGVTSVRACVALCAPGSRPEIVGVGIGRPSGITRGVITDAQQASDAINQAALQATGAAGRPVRRVHLGIGGEAIRVFPCMGATPVSNASGTVTHDDVRRAIQGAVQRVLPKDMEELHTLPRAYSVDKTRRDTPIGIDGGYLETELHLVAVQANVLRTVHRCVRMAGLRVESIYLDALASAAAALSDDIRHSGSALVDFGGDTTTVVVYSRNRVAHIASVPIGGNHVTSDIEHCFRIPFEAAEVIKQANGHASMAEVDPLKLLTVPRFEQRRPTQIKLRKLAWVIEARIDEWTRMVRNALLECNALGRLPGGVTLVGGGAMLAGLADRTSEALGTECVLGGATQVSGHLDMLRSPAMASTVGLVSCALAPPDQLEIPRAGPWRRRINRAFSWAMEAF